MTILHFRVAYRRSLSGCPLKMNHCFLITDQQDCSHVSLCSPCLLHLFVFLPIFYQPLYLCFRLTYPRPPQYPSISWLTAIRHWPCSVCLLPLPRVQPSHNYFLWFTVVGHCHPPLVFTAEITHTLFPSQGLLLLVHYPLPYPDHGLNYDPDIN